jgi:hypothetical protein
MRLNLVDDNDDDGDEEEEEEVTRWEKLSEWMYKAID